MPASLRILHPQPPGEVLYREVLRQAGSKALPRGSVLVKPNHCILMPPVLMIGHDSPISALMKGTERLGRALRLLHAH
jgi:hypothetical protein